MNCLTSCFSCFQPSPNHPGSAPGSSVEPTALERKVATVSPRPQEVLGQSYKVTAQSSTLVLGEGAEEMPTPALKTLPPSLASSTASEGLASEQQVEVAQKVSESSIAVLVAPSSVSGSINEPLESSFSQPFPLPHSSSLPVLEMINHEDLVVNIQPPLVPLTSLGERKVAIVNPKSQDSVHPYRITAPSSAPSSPILGGGIDEMLPFYAFKKKTSTSSGASSTSSSINGRFVSSSSQPFHFPHPSSLPIFGITSVPSNQNLVITIYPPSSSQTPSLPSSSSLTPIVTPTITVLPPNNTPIVNEAASSSQTPSSVGTVLLPNNPVVNQRTPSPQTPPPSIGFIAHTATIRPRGGAQEPVQLNENGMSLDLLRAGFLGEDEKVRMSSWHE